MKIALVSLDMKWEDKEPNKHKCAEIAIKANQQKAEMVIFPEMTLTGFSMNVGLISEGKESESIKFFSDLAKTYKFNVVFGYVKKESNGVYNELAVVDKTGLLIKTYSKIHSFSYAGENKYYKSGEKIEKCRINDFIFGLTICYDLRFPEIYSVIAPECNSIIAIANWPSKRIEHWKALLTARAIENQVFAIGVNRTGIDGNGLLYEKSSMIISPCGKVITPEYNCNELDVYNLEFDTVKQYREAFCTLKDKRFDFYSKQYLNRAYKPKS